MSLLCSVGRHQSRPRSASTLQMGDSSFVANGRFYVQSSVHFYLRVLPTTNHGGNGNIYLTHALKYRKPCQICGWVIYQICGLRTLSVFYAKKINDRTLTHHSDSTDASEKFKSPPFSTMVLPSRPFWVPFLTQTHQSTILLHPLPCV